MKILMVCLGKVEARKLKWRIDSAGTSGYHEGQLPDSRAIACMKKHGIDITYQQSRPIVQSDLKEFDLIYVMDKANLADVLSMTETEEEQRKIALIMSLIYEQKPVDVPDPYYGGDKGFENVYKMLDEATDAIIEKYGI
jgi:protein-tyrosine phosphatase